ncbi:uncharacterized membrane protein YphA, DoxX/SURF4 family [Bacteroidales bacterium 6E]|nr:uncharacterized membrane protein YphA, DoxX/SURF4 family [Bacteroidales bacterium 6E]
MLDRLTHTRIEFSTLLIRLMVGAVFLSEGIQKFLFAEEVGSGRFAKIGLPSPEILGPFVGTTEIIAGTLLLLGLFTRLAAIPTLVIMLVAISVTKIDIGLEQGVWEMLHASRTDWSMLIGSIFLLIRGGGMASVDLQINKRCKRTKAA